MVGRWFILNNALWTATPRIHVCSRRVLTHARATYQWRDSVRMRSGIADSPPPPCLPARPAPTTRCRANGGSALRLRWWMRFNETWIVLPFVGLVGLYRPHYTPPSATLPLLATRRPGYHATTLPHHPSTLLRHTAPSTDMPDATCPALPTTTPTALTTYLAARGPVSPLRTFNAFTAAHRAAHRALFVRILFR